MLLGKSQQRLQVPLVQLLCALTIQWANRLQAASTANGILVQFQLVQSKLEECNSAPSPMLYCAQWIRITSNPKHAPAHAVRRKCALSLW